MDILPICITMHRKILAGVCPWCRQPIRNGIVVGPKASMVALPDSSQSALEEVQRVLLTWLRERVDLSQVSDLASDTLRRELRLVVVRICEVKFPAIEGAERQTIVEAVLDRLLLGC